LTLLIFGIIGAFNSQALSWLNTQISVLNDVASAWEIIIGLIIFCVFIYFLIFRAGYRILFRRSDLEEGEGCSFVFWTIFFAGYIG